MKNCFFIFFIIITSCKVEKQDVSGYYVSFHSNLDRLNVVFNEDFFATGSTLTINKDSTFKMTTCGNVIQGNWKTHNDSLLLFKQSNRYKIDSLNQISDWKNKINVNPKNADIYSIKKNVLIMISTFKNTKGKEYKMIIKFKKKNLKSQS